MTTIHDPPTTTQYPVTVDHDPPKSRYGAASSPADSIKRPTLWACLDHKTVRSSVYGRKCPRGFSGRDAPLNATALVGTGHCFDTSLCRSQANETLATSSAPGRSVCPD